MCNWVNVKEQKRDYALSVNKVQWYFLKKRAGQTIVSFMICYKSRNVGVWTLTLFSFKPLKNKKVTLYKHLNIIS